MPILPNVSPGVLNSADELRALLDKCEIGITQLNRRSSAESAVNLLHLIDRAEDLTATLEAAAQSDVRAERSRLETVKSQVRRKARVVTHAARRGSRLQQERQELNPDKTRWWWYIDGIVMAENLRLLRKWGAAVFGIVALLFGGTLLLRVLFPPDPIKSAVIEHTFNAENLIRNAQDYAGALVEIEAALAVAPDNWDLHLWRGVLQEMVGRTTEAETSFAKARELLADDLSFYASRGMMYHQLAETERAMADGYAVLELDATEPRGYWIISLGYEFQGKIPEALAAAETAADLAQEQNDLEFVAMARTRQAMLLQIMPGLILTPPASP